MHRRRWLRFALWTLMAAGCGGGARPTMFSDNARPLGEGMRAAVKSRDVAKVTKAAEAAKLRYENQTIAEVEWNVLKACEEYAKEGKWDEAKDLIDKSLAVE